MRISPVERDARLHSDGFLTRLRRDRRGNALVMMAMATIPLAGMVGSAIDISRGYLIKSRLQQACDAGVLATRRAMTSNVMDASSVTQGTKFFNVNFSANTAGTTSAAFSVTNSAAGEVTGTGTAVVPMTITRMFGTNNVTLTVTCGSRLEIPNTDVMFVLDTTGSMNDCPDNSACNGNASSKIAGIRSAVLDFYDTMATSVPPGAQLRYGFVPYSSTVNVGATLSSSWVPTDWTYRSRVANFNTRVDPVDATESRTNTSSAQCTVYQVNRSYPTLDGPTYSTTDAAGFTTTLVYSAISWTNSNSGTCTRNRRTSVSPTAYSFTNFTYRSESYDLSTFKTGSSVNVATATPASTVYVGSSRPVDMVELAAIPTYGGAEETTTWGGCIEERDTVPNATFNYGTIPAAAYDLDIDALPSSTPTMWRPWWPQIVWSSGGSRPFASAANGYAACPTAALKMGIMTRSAVQTYVNGLSPIGGTYHDTGMIWGARLISPTGIFASENATAPNGQPITRNIIFMTDGQMAPNPTIYGMYGYEADDRRISGASPGPGSSPYTELINRHNSRFRAMCDAARAKNIRIWVVGFGTSLSSDMTACADPGQAFQASNTATLRAQFAQIASQVARLRLSQ
ncbi:MAG: pilus assembly protein TadG-related protein [Sphingomonadales bacterium]